MTTATQEGTEVVISMHHVSARPHRTAALPGATVDFASPGERQVAVIELWLPVPTAGDVRVEAGEGGSRHIRRTRKRSARTPDLVKDVEFILATGERAFGVTRRPGYSASQSLERALYRAGRADLIAALHVAAA